MSSFRIWLLAIRPKTLVASLAPIAIGATLAGREQSIDFLILILILLSAVCIQIGTNLANDYSDFKSGADTAERLGPTRVTQAGLLTPKHVLSGAIIFFTTALLFGLQLIAKGGWPILLIGILGIACGYLYTGGPYPLGYNGLGELFVLLFFGIFAVAGTHYLLTGYWTSHSFILGLCPGLLSSALLAVNNLRDIETDESAGKRTLAVRFGRRFGRAEYVFCIVVPFIICILMAGIDKFSWGLLLPVLSMPLALIAIRIVTTKTSGPTLNHALVQTAKLSAIFGFFLCVGLII